MEFESQKEVDHLRLLIRPRSGGLGTEVVEFQEYGRVLKMAGTSKILNRPSIKSKTKARDITTSTIIFNREEII